MQIQENISMSKYTTYKVGGLARFFAEPSNTQELVECFQFSKTHSTDWFIVGKGSNLVVSDHGFDGLIIYIGKTLKDISIQDSILTAQGGALLHQAVAQSVNAGLEGMQHLAGIPGTIGGGVYINAGAFSQELVQTLIEVESVDPNGNIHIRKGSECGLSYRDSYFFQWNEVITKASFQLQKSSAETMKLQMNETLKKRKGKQPLEYPNAGSMYKRPEGSYAGKLIEEAKLKGFEVGGAQISPHHANFVINTGKATAQNIYDLSIEVIDRVKANSGITLEREQIFIGKF
jgi:UDP-N-acetylmuramate dehydrogenase